MTQTAVHLKALVFRVDASGTLTLNTSQNDVTGDASPLTVVDSAGSNTITGGSGGLFLTSTGPSDVVSTEAGAVDTVRVVDRTAVTSAGTDAIYVTGNYSAIEASGTTTINCLSGYDGFQLDGFEKLNFTGSNDGQVAIGAAGHDTVVSSTNINLTKTAGGFVTFVETQTGADDTANVSGGSATLSSTSGSFGGIAITTGGAGSSDAVSLGTGNSTVNATGSDAIATGTGTAVINEGAGNVAVYLGNGSTTINSGTGRDAFLVNAGDANRNITINNFNVAHDHVSFVGFAGSAVLAERLGAGTSLITLTDGTTISISTIDGTPVVVGPSGTSIGSQTFALSTSGHSLIGLDALLTVTDSAGANSIAGGIGGLVASITGAGDVVTTEYAASDRITFADNATVYSNGNDLLTAAGANANVFVGGRSTISSGSGFTTFTLNGADLLNASGAIAVTVGSTANATVNATGSTTDATIVNGGALTLTQAESGPDARVAVSGGAATVVGSTGAGGISVTTDASSSTNVTVGAGNATVASGGSDIINLGSGSAVVTDGAGDDTVRFGSGPATVTGGGGTDTYVFTSGSVGGAVTINDFKVGTDELVFSGYRGSALSSVTTNAGATVVTLNDHTTITVNTSDGTPVAVGPTGVGHGLLPPDVLTVGAGMEFAHLADALKAARDGDTIEVQAGTYLDDFGTVNAKVTIEGVGGMVHLEADEEPNNGKGLLVVNDDLTLKNFEISGGTDNGPDGNIAGIRYQAGNLVLQYCYIYNNQDGLLATPLVLYTGSITVENSEFAFNGAGDGFSHNLYIGPVSKATVTNSYMHDANVGHELKSRALTTIIQNNLIADGRNGTASYDIDIPNAGNALISGNVIEKGPNASNATMIHYGGETQFHYPSSSLVVTDNTVINDYDANVAIGVNNQSAANGLNVVAGINKNAIYGLLPSRIDSGASDLSNNTVPVSEPTYSLPSTWRSAPVLPTSTGPQSMVLTTTNNVVTDGSERLTVTDLVGSNTIDGSGGGIDVTSAGIGEVISTSAGANDTVSIVDRSTVLSAGNDLISVSGLYSNVIASGNATINSSSAFSLFTLNGSEILNTSGGAAVTIGGASAARVTVLTGSASLTKTAGGRVILTQTETGKPNDVALVSGAGAATITSTGGVYGQIDVATGSAGGVGVRLYSGTTSIASAGADTIWANTGTGIVNATGSAKIFGGSGSTMITSGAAGVSVTASTGNLTLTGGSGNDTFVGGSGSASVSGGGGADVIQFGPGNTTATGGAGNDQYIFSAVSGGGHDLITDFNPSADTITYQHFSGSAVQSVGSIAVNGVASGLVTLTDGTQITFLGVTQPFG